MMFGVDSGPVVGSLHVLNDSFELFLLRLLNLDDEVFVLVDKFVDLVF